MEPAVLQPGPSPPRPRYVFFDLSAAGLRCFSPPPTPAAEHTGGVPFGTQVMGLEALHRTRLSRAASRPRVQAGAAAAMARCVHVQTGDPDTVSDAATPGVRAAEESEDEVDSFDERVVWHEGFARKIDALAELVGIKVGAYEPAAVLGEVVRVLQAIERKGRSV
ncbi:hypothetical protein BS78_03G230100 [Paspalum vaginatum]|nr:hypothetical protein BS78_03G230100 [Paspalum vaginatum]KAJ1284761.1 hypothetical protein BS78_03G230100 [Paspalum vaginatum]